MNRRVSNHCRHRGVTPRRLEGLRILVAEDCPMNRKLIVHRLQQAGASVAGAADGIDAVGAACQEAFDLILMDVEMPIVDGFKAATTILEDDPDVPIVILTAHDEHSCIRRAQMIGCRALLRKPVTPPTLTAACARYARGAREDLDDSDDALAERKPA